MICRPDIAPTPYAKSTKMVSFRGMIRPELNRPLRFANIEGSNWDSIFRGSLVVEMKAKFFPAVAFDKFPVDKREAAWNFRKGDTLKKFLESGPAALAFIRALYRYMNDNATKESRGEIDIYARSDGATWRVIREACGLSIQKPPVDLGNPLVVDPDEARLKSLTELSDAMDAVAIKMNAEVLQTQSSYDYMWEKLARPRPVAAPKIKASGRKHFDQMIQAGLWVKHGQTQTGNAVYRPVIRCNGSMRAIYAAMGEEKEPTFPEIANQMAIQRYSESEAMWKNSAILRDYDVE